MGGSATKRPLQPISALNPYNNNWAVKAKVVNKGPKRRCMLGQEGGKTVAVSGGSAPAIGTKRLACCFRPCP